MGHPARDLDVQPSAELTLYDPDCQLERRYDHWLRKTGDASAAAVLTLAAVHATAQPVSKENCKPRDVLTPPQVGKLLGVDSATVRSWIRSGQLKASNVGKGGQRPRFRVRQSDVDAFLKSRQPQVRTKAKRRFRQPVGEIEFF